MVQISVRFSDNFMIMPSSTHFICIYKNVILYNLGSIVIAINTTDWANLNCGYFTTSFIHPV